MPVSVRLRLVACAALAAAAATLAAARVLPLGPRLAIDVHQRFARDTFDVYHLDISAVGGETIERVVVTPLRGSVRVHPPGETRELGPGTRFRAVVSVSHGVPTDVPPAVRVRQEGRVPLHWDVPLGPEGGP